MTMTYVIFKLKLDIVATIVTLEALLALALALDTVTSSHTSSGAELFISIATETNGIGAVHLTTEALNRDSTSLGAGSNSLADNDVKSSTSTSSVAFIGKAVSGVLVGLVTLGNEITHEASTFGSGAEDLEFRKKFSDVSGDGVSTIVSELILRNATSISETISLTDSNTLMSKSARSGTILVTEFREFRDTLVVGALSEEEVTALTLTSMEGFLSGVINDVPTGTVQESKSEFRKLSSRDIRSSHHFVKENSSFEVSTQTTATTFIFKRSTGDLITTVMLSKLGGKGFNVNELDSVALDYDILGMLAVRKKEVFIESGTETEDVGKFVEGSVEVFSMDERVTFIDLDVGKVEVDGGDEGSAGSTVEDTGSSSGNVTFTGSIRNSGKDDEISVFNTLSDIGSGDATITSSSEVTKIGRSDLILSRVLELQGSLEVVNNSRHKSLGDVVMMLLGVNSDGGVVGMDSEERTFRLFHLQGFLGLGRHGTTLTDVTVLLEEFFERVSPSSGSVGFIIRTSIGDFINRRNGFLSRLGRLSGLSRLSRLFFLDGLNGFRLINSDGFIINLRVTFFFSQLLHLSKFSYDVLKLFSLLLRVHGLTNLGSEDGIIVITERTLSTKHISEGVADTSEGALSTLRDISTTEHVSEGVDSSEARTTRVGHTVTIDFEETVEVFFRATRNGSLTIRVNGDGHGLGEALGLTSEGTEASSKIHIF